MVSPAAGGTTGLIWERAARYHTRPAGAGMRLEWAAGVFAVVIEGMRDEGGRLVAGLLRGLGSDWLWGI